jgi:hypothetical protein
MRFMMIVKATADSEAGVLPSAELLQEMGRYNDELVKAGVLLAGEGLHPSAKGVRLVFEGGKRTLVDGPFAETKELVAGFWLIQTRSREEAIEWLKRVPNPMPDAEGVIELRQVFSPEDFGPELQAAAPDVFEGERKFREAEEARAAAAARTATNKA